MSCRQEAPRRRSLARTFPTACTPMLAQLAAGAPGPAGKGGGRNAGADPDSARRWACRAATDQPDQRRRSALTVIRRNWHLLPYDQLLALLGWTARQLAYTLREDDFLFIKLGSVKPPCEPLHLYSPPGAEACGARARSPAWSRGVWPAESRHRPLPIPYLASSRGPRAAGPAPQRPEAPPSRPASATPTLRSTATRCSTRRRIPTRTATWRGWRRPASTASGCRQCCTNWRLSLGSGCRARYQRAAGEPARAGGAGAAARNRHLPLPQRAARHAARVLQDHPGTEGRRTRATMPRSAPASRRCSEYLTRFGGDRLPGRARSGRLLHDHRLGEPDELLVARPGGASCPRCAGAGRGRGDRGGQRAASQDGIRRPAACAADRLGLGLAGRLRPRHIIDCCPPTWP